MRQRIAVAALGLCSAVSAETPQEAARKTMEASIARQRQAVAAMQMAIEKQRAAVADSAVQSSTGGTPVPAVSMPFFTLSWPAPGAGCDPLPEAELKPLIQQAAEREGVDATLLRAVAQQESDFRPCAVSRKGAMGLMQLMPATAGELGVHDPFDAAESLLSGAHLLKQLLARFSGDTALALGAYNAGPERVAETGGVPQIPETIRYVEQILSKIP